LIDSLYGAILSIAVVQVIAAMDMGPSLWHMLLLAAIQAYLPVMFFMHLRDEKPNKKSENSANEW
jgi:heme/copper-type cytochrome/quinol oxidase subunit 4